MHLTKCPVNKQNVIWTHFSTNELELQNQFQAYWESNVARDKPYQIPSQWQIELVWEPCKDASYQIPTQEPPPDQRQTWQESSKVIKTDLTQVTEKGWHWWPIPEMGWVKFSSGLFTLHTFYLVVSNAFAWWKASGCTTMLFGFKDIQTRG